MARLATSECSLCRILPIYSLISPVQIVQTVITRPTGEHGFSAVDQKPLDPKHLGDIIASEEGQTAKVEELKLGVKEG